MGPGKIEGLRSTPPPGDIWTELGRPALLVPEGLPPAPPSGPDRQQRKAWQWTKSLEARSRPWGPRLPRLTLSQSPELHTLWTGAFAGPKVTR